MNRRSFLQSVSSALVILGVTRTVTAQPAKVQEWSENVIPNDIQVEKYRVPIESDRVIWYLTVKNSAWPKFVGGSVILYHADNTEQRRARLENLRLSILVFVEEQGWDARGLDDKLAAHLPEMAY